MSGRYLGGVGLAATLWMASPARAASDVLAPIDGCHRFSIQLDRRVRVGLGRVDRERYQLDAVLDAGDWQVRSWERLEDSRPGLRVGPDRAGTRLPFWPPVLGHGQLESDDALTAEAHALLGDLLVSVSSPSAELADEGPWLRDERMVLVRHRGGEKLATLDVSVWHDPVAGVPRRWQGHLTGPISLGGADGKARLFRSDFSVAVDADGLPERERVRHRLGMLLFRVSIEQDLRYSAAGDCVSGGAIRS